MLIEQKNIRRLKANRLFQVGLCTLAFLAACTPKTSATTNYTVVKSFVESKNIIIPQLQQQSEQQLQLDLQKELPLAKNIQKSQKDHHTPFLYLPHLSSLSLDQAEAIADHGGRIYLNGVENMSVPVAQKLFAGTFDEIQLNGIQSMDTALARVLYEQTSFQTDLQLNNLSSLELAAAQYLIHSGSYISLKKVVDIIPSPPATLSSKKRSPYKSISLPGLTRLSPTVAKDLFQHKSSWNLNGIQEVNDDLLRVMGNSPITSLQLNGLTSISAQQLALLNGSQPKNLELNGIRTISPETTKAFAELNMRSLGLNKLENIAPHTLQILLQNPQLQSISLDGINQIEDTHAELLGQFHGESLSLSGIKTISPKQADSLARFQGQSIFLYGIQDLPIQQAKALSRFQGISIALESASPKSLKICKACEIDG